MANILIADDSPTIHKVVQLTLASSGHDLEVAPTIDELYSKVEANNFDLVLLDFTLSDSLDGYELAKKVNAIKKSRILAMLGTFDSIDDSKMVDAGILDKIQKPFESQKFINLCNQLIETDLDSFISNDPAKSETSSSNEEEGLDDDWIVNEQGHQESASVEIEEDVLSTESENQSSDEIATEFDSWGMSVPGVIGKKADDPLFPPVIDSGDKKVDLESLVNEDLAEDGNTFDFNGEENQKNLAFQSLTDLAPEEDDTWASEVTDTTSSDDLKNKIDLENIDSDDFWATDDQQAGGDSESQDEENIEVREDLAPREESETSPFSFVDDHEHAPAATMKEEDLELPEPHKQSETSEIASAPMNGVSIDEIVSQVIARLTPQLEEIVQKAIASKIEEVSWEVIPDLAENLIKNEIRRISESVTNSH